MKNSVLNLLNALCVCVFASPAAHAATALSQYGQIQNVQNYSSNPFWSPGSQYNQRIMPTAVYATGPDVTTSDCQSIVANLIAAQCAARANCNGMRIADIRPTIMLELSRLPGHNFATSCSGYIDSAFNTYINQYANAVKPTAFPVATGPSNAQTNNDFKIQNPYAPKVPEWKAEIADRASELQQLQAENGAGTERIAKASFPTTINDVSFTDRMENLATGYAPYKDAKAYNSIKVESPEDALKRQIATLELQRQTDELTMSNEEYCDKYPLDDKKCVQTPGLTEKIIAIGNRPAQSDTKPEPSPESKQKPTADNSVSVVAKQNTPPVVSSPSSINNNAPARNNRTVIADNKTRGGPCTPSARSDWFPNKILTSGKYESIDPAFEKAMTQFFRMEGECGHHKADRGGYTCYGFAQNSNPDIDVRTLTRPAAEDRTYERIYKANKIDKLPDSVRGDVLRGWFGSGYYGVQQMQKVLGLPLTKTGRVDDAMAHAAENYEGDLHNDYWDQMQKYYVGITERNKSQKVFLKGWMNGVKLMRENGCHVEPTVPLTR